VTSFTSSRYVRRNSRLPIILFFGGLAVLSWLPIMATVADRVNRRTVLNVVTLLAAVTAYPMMFWLASGPKILQVSGR
jgi:MHS family citrate/tricarballylate:H+ symporter-like MFS transporter